MFAFVIYAIAVWYAAARWRRQWLSLAWVTAGFLGLVLVGYFHSRLNVWSNGQIYLPVLRVLLYPYTLMVVAVGLYIAALPRRNIRWEHCPLCEYDLRGLDQPIETCPECGMNEELARLALGRRYTGFPAPPTDAAIPGARATEAPGPAPVPAAPPWPANARPSATLDPSSG